MANTDINICTGCHVEQPRQHLPNHCTGDGRGGGSDHNYTEQHGATIINYVRCDSEPESLILTCTLHSITFVIIVTSRDTSLSLEYTTPPNLIF